MSDHSRIEWTDATWNPVVGCSKVSPGCQNCYAERIANRLARMGKRQYQDVTAAAFQYEPDVPHMRGAWNGKTAFVESALTQPLRWRKPRRIFVCSMGDLFHESVPFEWIDRVFAIMALCPQHTFQVLTKRAKRMREYMGQTATGWPADDLADIAWEIHFKAICQAAEDADDRDIECMRDGETPRFDAKWSAYDRWKQTLTHWPLPNVHLGVTAEDQQRADERIPELLATPAAVRFVSYEPAVGPLELHIPRGCRGCNHPGNVVPRETCTTCGGTGHEPTIDWVIAGGESGPGARPAHPDWFRQVRDDCAAAGVPFFFKQWGEWVHWTHPALNGEAHQPHNEKGWAMGFPKARAFTWPDYTDSYRIGKKAAGRLLDGRTHDELPGGAK